MPFPPDPRAILAKRHLLAKATFLPKSLAPYTSPARAFPFISSRNLTSTPIVALNNTPAMAFKESSAASFSSSSTFAMPRKNAQDREDISTESTEYTKSGDDSQAAHEEAAFDPENTSPEGEKGSGGKADENPLEVSPANPEVSKPRGNQEGGAEESGKDNKKSGSGFGSPKKEGDGNEARKH